MLSEFLEKVYAAITSLSLDVTLYIVWGAFAFVFLLALVLCFFNAGVRRADKRPFLSFVNAFTAVTLAVMLTEKGLPFSVLVSAVFWCVGYMLYGIIVISSRRKNSRADRSPVSEIMPPADRFPPAVRPARTNVRTEHALSVTEKLLSKDLGKGDRQEVERIKSVLGVMQLKGDLTPEENERLNDNFNTLLKLMAKYGL